jgi:hypothetical protein
MRALFTLAVCGLTLGAVGCTNGPGRGAGDLKPGQHFALAVEQDGATLPIADRQVVLKRAPFVVVITFAAPDSVLVNASCRPDTYEAARKGAPLIGTPAFSGTGMRGELFNKDKLLVLADEGYGNWKYFSEKIHNFDDAANVRGAWVCRRTIAKCREGAEEPRDIAKLDKPAVYMVFVKTEWDASHSRVEKQRECVKLVFGP